MISEDGDSGNEGD